jgi:hypothetical protein
LGCTLTASLVSRLLSPPLSASLAQAQLIDLSVNHDNH